MCYGVVQCNVNNSGPKVEPWGYRGNDSGIPATWAFNSDVKFCGYSFFVYWCGNLLLERLSNFEIGFVYFHPCGLIH